VPELGAFGCERSGEACIERPNEKAIHNVCRKRDGGGRGRRRGGQDKKERETERERERERERDLQNTRPLWGISLRLRVDRNEHGLSTLTKQDRDMFQTCV
jgi:hypothetical protein